MAKHFQRWLFVIVIHLGAILHDSYVSGLRCLECQEVFKPEDCALSGECGQDELCLTRSFIDATGRPAYRLGCETTDVCDLYKDSEVLIGKRATGQERPCRQCCSHDNCNGKLCAESTTNATSVPTPTSSRDCQSFVLRGMTSSGLYSVNPDGGTPFKIFCDMDADGEGWTVIQRRVNGSVGFYNNWNQYKKGFGSLDGNFWLGNEHLHRLTSQAERNYTLRFLLTVSDGTVYKAFYYNFTVAGENDKYRVKFKGFDGNVADSFGYHNGMQFSTYDSDNDKLSGNCAQAYRGGWWYNKCHDVNINGLYGVQGDTGMVWDKLTGLHKALTATSMAIGTHLKV